MYYQYYKCVNNIKLIKIINTEKLRFYIQVLLQYMRISRNLILVIL